MDCCRNLEPCAREKLCIQNQNEISGEHSQFWMNRKERRVKTLQSASGQSVFNSYTRPMAIPSRRWLATERSHNQAAARRRIHRKAALPVCCRSTIQAFDVGLHRACQSDRWHEHAAVVAQKFETCKCGTCAWQLCYEEGAALAPPLEVACQRRRRARARRRDASASKPNHDRIATCQISNP